MSLCHFFLLLSTNLEKTLIFIDNNMRGNRCYILRYLRMLHNSCFFDASLIKVFGFCIQEFAQTGFEFQVKLIVKDTRANWSRSRKDGNSMGSSLVNRDAIKPFKQAFRWRLLSYWWGEEEQCRIGEVAEVTFHERFRRVDPIVERKDLHYPPSWTSKWLCWHPQEDYADTFK